MNKINELEIEMTGGPTSIKIELEEDFEPRLNELNESLTKIKEEEKFILKYALFHE